MKSYYLIRTKPRQEKIAYQNLVNQNYDPYMPMALIKGKTTPLFPGYLFVYIDDKNQNWAPIRSTVGVLNFIKFGKEFAKVPDTIISLIQNQEQQIIDKLIDINSFHSGDLLEVNDGPFKGQQVIFQQYKPNERVIVLLNLINKTHKVEMSTGNIQTYN